MSKKIPTIGYLTDELDGNYQRTIWHGVENAVKKHGVNLINFVGGMLDVPQHLPRNVVYDLVDPKALDGLIILSATIRGQVPLERMEGFLQNYSDIPIVSIGVSTPDAPNIHTISVDNKKGLENAMVHLIEDHGYRRIAFISGPETHEQAQQRYHVYTEALAKYDIPFDPKLVTYGFFDAPSGQQAVELYLDERQVEFDAIVAANDYMAIGAMNELTSRGIKVPHEVAIVGFDDASRAKSISPPLTTVRQSIYTQGYQAVETLMSMLEGQATGNETILPTELVVRQSCGCFSQSALQATIPQSAFQSNASIPNLDEILRQQQDQIVADMIRAMDAQTVSQVSGWADNLFEAILTDLAVKPTEDVIQGAFIRSLENILSKTTLVEDDDNAAEWQNLISTLRRSFVPFLHDFAVSMRAENIWGQARVLIGEVSGRLQMERHEEVSERAHSLREIGSRFMATFDLDHVKDVLISEMPGLGIPGCYLSLCEDPNAPTDKVKMLAAYNEQGAIAFDSDKAVFPAQQLVPEGMLPTDRNYVIIVQPLHFEDDHLGYILFEKEHQEGIVYDTLRAQISSSLKGALLVEQEEKRVHQLHTVGEVSSVTSTILNQEELLQRVVDLTKERFGLYHAHIYMLNEHRDTLYLAAGAGKVGQQMMAEGWRIPVTTKQSLIAEVARSGNFIIVDDVHQRKGWLPNSHLPNTASEMAVPVLSKGEVIGVLDVQSDEIGGLEESDANLLLSLAKNVAISLTNANLFAQTVQAKEEAERVRHEAESARQEAETAKQAMEVQVWQTKGQAELNDKIRGEQDIATLADSVVEQLCEYLGAQIGALYISDGDSLELTGTFAYSTQQENGRFHFGEGLVGQAAKKNKAQLVTDIPPDYISIRSGLGETKPRHIMVVPFTYEDRVVGVLEIGTLTQFNQVQLAFLDTAMSNIGIVFNTAQARKRINELLSQTQQQTEELQAQGEELRVANEELEAQTESLRASEAKLREKQIELESTNVQLEEKAAALEESSMALHEKQSVLDQQNQELKVAQQDLEGKAEELALASKYKSEFLANMSHELRTPLNSLLILAHMLTENKHGNLDEDELESIEIIYNGGNDLLNLINDILDLSKVESGKMEFTFKPMPLHELASTVHTQFDHIAVQKELALNISLAEDLPESIETDQQRVTQIIKNLLSNAFKFTAEGSVNLDISRPAADANLSRSGLKPAEAVAISVADSGIGMTAEQKKIIFEAFQQADGSTSRRYGGTGLGLSISRELTSKLGGQIDVESEPGQGSTFTLYLPIAKPTVGDETTAVSPPKTQTPRIGATGLLRTPTRPLPTNNTAKSAPVSSKLLPMPTDDRDNLQSGDKVLLLIEDDPKFAKVINSYAHDKGFKNLIAGTGQAGLDLAFAHQPDAIILDLNLPDMTGWQILEAIKNNPSARHIPVHIMSVEDEDLGAYRKGAMGYITKPVSKTELDSSFSKIREFVDRDIKSLLLVEDDDVSRHSIKKLLDNDMVEISEAALGKTAVDMLQSQHFDCMILDLSLPDMSGFEVLETLNQKGIAEKCPIIIYTGRDLTAEENMKLMKYADSVIVKGVKSPERLLDETALFLHQVVADMSEEKQRTIKQLYNQDDLLKGKKILIVDDDMRNSFALSKLLADKEMAVRIAQHGQKALELLEQESFDLILMDIMMPIMDGYETTKRIRAQEKYNGLPILALTAKAMKGDREKCIAAGANDYLPKPVNVDRLFSMLRVWLYQ